nr:globin domain-containing protein [Motilibacter aurantiacus]
MRRSFEIVGANGDEVPLFFYSHLFLNYPETRSLFPVSMMTQRDRLFAALGHIVTNVDDVDVLVPFLQDLGRDHRKFGTLAEHYPAVGASLLATLEHFAGDAWTPELAADWAEAYGVIATVMTEAAAESDEPAWWDARVVSHERRTLDIAVIRLEPRQRLDFSPGQAVAIETELRPRLWRYYAVANAPREDNLIELHVRAQDGGPVSSALVRHLSVGDPVRLGPAQGDLVLDGGSDRDLLLVAGGTGVSALKAILDQVTQDDVARRVDFYVGARTVEELYDLESLQELARAHPWVTLVPVVSDEDGFAGEKGLVSDIVVRDGPWASRDVYVCGSPSMVDETVKELVKAGVPEHRIRAERFAPSRPGPSAEGSLTS